MLDLIKNLLDVNAIERGGIKLTIVPIDVRTVLEGLTDNYRQRAQAKNITLQYQSAAHAQTVHADEQALVQVLENLISNAVKYSPPDKNVAVTVQEIRNVPATEPPAQHLNALLQRKSIIITVKDEGPGLSDEDKAKLFGKFARLSAQPTAGEDSTGLGLSIVKRLVEAMHGRVWCESEFGHGAAFRVALPMEKMTEKLLDTSPNKIAQE